MKRRTLKKRAISAFSLLALLSANVQATDVFNLPLFETVDENNIYLNLEGNKIKYEGQKTNNFENNLVAFSNISTTDEGQGGTKLYFYHSIPINENQIDGYKDHGFIKGSMSTHSCLFLQSKDAKKYIESIEIKWSENQPNGGSIWLHASPTFQYTTTTVDQISSKFNEETDIELTLSPVSTNDGIAIYRLNKPTQYLALTPTPEASKYAGSSTTPEIARVSYIRIHFVNEWTAPEPENENLDVQFGMQEDVIDNLEWTRDEVIADNYVFLKEGLDIDDYEFYITADFEPQNKPDLNGEKPENLTDREWRILGELEEHSLSYDGYYNFEKEHKIICEPIEGDGCYSLSIPAPCSGLYDLKVRVKNSNEVVSANAKKLNIWPGIRVTYGSDLDKNYQSQTDLDPHYYFALNMVNFPGKTVGDIMNYPLDPYYTDQPYTKDNVEILIPGCYGYKVYYKWNNDYMNFREYHIPEKESTILKSTRSDEDDTLAEYKDADIEPIHLTNLKKNSSETLSMRIAKNGAITPVESNGNSAIKFDIMLTDSVYDDPLWVEEITSPNIDMEEYFDLSGNRVNPHNLCPGIYIRRSASQTTKIIIR